MNPKKLPVLPYEQMAMRGDPIPQNLDVADTCAYVSLQHLYAMYRQNLISREDAQKEKEHILYNIQSCKSVLAFLSRASLGLQERIKNASENYLNNPTIENADELYGAFYNMKKDWREEWRREREKNENNQN